MEYNTARNKLIVKEYGRNIQKMVEHSKKIIDLDKKQQAANYIVELMGYLNTANKNLEDFTNKLWDHLFVIANFELDVKSPYTIPTKEIINKKPERIKYPKRLPKFMHLGKNLEYLMEKAKNEKDEFKKQYMIHIIMNYMKHAYNTWHKDNAQEETLKNELTALSKGALVYESNPVIKQLLKNEKSEKNDHDKPERPFRKNNSRNKAFANGGYIKKRY